MPLDEEVMMRALSGLVQGVDLSEGPRYGAAPTANLPGPLKGEENRSNQNCARTGRTRANVRVRLQEAGLRLGRSLRTREDPLPDRLNLEPGQDASILE